MSAFEFSIDEESLGLRLDQWFLRRYPSLSKARVEQLLRSGQIRVNKGRARSHYRLQASDVIRVPPPLGADSPPAPQSDLSDALKNHWRARLPSLILYEDADIIALNKPSGLAVQGGSGIKLHLDKLLPLLVAESDPRPRLVHRLDKDTSGVLLLAKNRQAAKNISDDFKHQRIAKLYWAVTAGIPPQNEGRIAIPIEKQTHKQFERMHTTTKDQQHPIPETLYRRLQTSQSNETPIAWLACSPLSGKTHQIRVHLNAIGTPIIGDTKYGGKKNLPPLPAPNKINRIALHARAIRYNNKIITAPPDESFTSIMQAYKLKQNMQIKDQFLC